MASPAWANELTTLLPATPHFVLAGNVHDVYLVEPQLLNENIEGSIPLFSGLPRVVAGVMRGRGIACLLTCEPMAPFEVFQYDGEDEALNTTTRSLGEDALGASLDSFDTTSLKGLASVIEALSRADSPVGLLVTGASRLLRSSSNLTEEEFDFFRIVERCSRNTAPLQGTHLFNPVIWVVESEGDLPAWYTSRNENVRTIVVPAPDAGDRAVAAQKFLGNQISPTQHTPVRDLAAHSAGLTLVEMRRAVSLGRDQGIDPSHIEDAVRSYRVGTVDNPWRRSYVRERLQYQLDGRSASTRETVGQATEEPDQGLLSQRVLGQEHAVRKTLDILVRSVAGLTGAQAAASATRPRGVLFFAGPTGVGKTELAKALTQLLFDDESLCTRFDMSEFSAEHAADRLIGSPPGYQGNAAGGELTNAMRQRPFSVVLFDEIEKAHPRILDKFLQVLDDGRLTDGRGETAFFTESVIVFTSNLGIYGEVEDVGVGGIVGRRREMTAGPDLPHDEFAEKVAGSIKEFFTRDLGRPELLNRIGDNIVVFDFITPEVGLKILSQMLGRLSERVEQEYRVTLLIEPAARTTIAESCVNEATLELGGRGIGSKLETVVVNPLANNFFVRRPDEGTSVSITKIESTSLGWELETR